MTKTELSLRFISLSFMAFLVSGGPSNDDPTFGFRGESISSTEIKLTWDLPSQEVFPVKSEVLGYDIKYGSDSKEFESIRVQSDQRWIILQDLRPFTSYRVSITPFSRLGTGYYSPSIIVRTKQEVPSKPRITHATLRTSDSMYVHWERPRRFNGQLIGYTLKWSDGKDIKTQMILGHLTNPMTAFINELTPYTQYTVQVAAGTEAGMGEFSDEFPALTDVSAPSVPRNVTVNTRGSNSVQIAWEAPETFYRVIDSYVIKYWNHPGNEQSIMVNGDKTTLTLGNLITNSRYYLKVAAITSSMFLKEKDYVGDFTEPVAFTLGMDVMKLTANPERLHLLTTHSLTINCTYQPEPSLDTETENEVISLILSKSSEERGESAEELAWIDGGSKVHIPKKNSSQDVIYSGEYHKEGKASYNVAGSWSNVTEDLKGEYTCTLNIKDSTGQVITISEQITIEVANLSFKDFTKEVKRLNENLKEVKKHNRLMSLTDPRFKDARRKARKLNKKLKEIRDQMTSNQSLSVTDSPFKDVLTEVLHLSKKVQELKGLTTLKNQTKPSTNSHLKNVLKEVRNLEKELKDQKAINQVLSSQLAEIQTWKDSVTLSLSALVDASFLTAYSKGYENRTYVSLTEPIKDVKFADAICQVNGGYLAEVNDKEEWNFIKSFLASSGVARAFIAGRRNVAKNQWIWPRNGQMLSYFDWHSSSKPNQAVENCIETVKDVGWQWKVVLCQNRFSGFICEIPMV